MARSRTANGRKGGKDLEEFKEWDRNDDGFITAEEVLAKLRIDAIAKANTEIAEGSEPSASEEGSERPMMRGKGMRGGGDGSQGMAAATEAIRRRNRRQEGSGRLRRLRRTPDGDTSKKGRGNFGDFFKKKSSE